MIDIDRSDDSLSGGCRDLIDAPVDRHIKDGQDCPVKPSNRAPTSDHRPLSALLRERTTAVHTEAERTGVIADILRRRADRHDYAMLLRNLLPAYERLEAGLSHRATHRVVSVFARQSLYRAESIRSDLARIHGEDWERALPVLDSAVSYTDRIARAAGGDGLALVPHAYVRYFGDLSGGQVLKRLLGNSLALAPEALTFYDFFGIDMHAVKNELRDAIDHAGRIAGNPEGLIQEAIAAFEHNIQLSRDVQAAGINGENINSADALRG